MNLDFFNNIVNNLKNNEKVQNFVNELQKEIEKTVLNNTYTTQQTIANNTEILNKTQGITTEYRDKINLAKRELLEQYASNTSELGTMYEIYNKIGNEYLATICEENRSNEVIKINENELPQDATINSILREQDGKYILDNEATEILNKEIEEKCEELINEQNIIMEERRKEGHIYEFVEKSGESIFLIDNTNNNNIAFEELEFNKETFKNAQEGELFKFTDGEYYPY